MKCQMRTGNLLIAASPSLIVATCEVVSSLEVFLDHSAAHPGSATESGDDPEKCLIISHLLLFAALGR